MLSTEIRIKLMGDENKQILRILERKKKLNKGDNTVECL